MTKLLEEAIVRLRKLPPALQDNAARVLIRELDEDAEPGDREATEEARQEFQRGDFVTLEQLEHEMGPGDR